jgi:hypothetical protein
MSWQLVLTILAGWVVIPALAWALALEVMLFVRYEDHHSISGTGGGGSGSGRFHLRQFRQVQRYLGFPGRMV